MKIKYQNEKLRKRVEDDFIMFPVNLFCLVLGVTLCAVSIVRTVRDMGAGSAESFWKILSEQHPIGLSFGITFLIAAAIFINLSRGFNVLRHLRPACGSKRYTPAEIDAEANRPDAKWYSGYDIYVTPNVLIGTNRGMAAVAYSDIEKVYVRSRFHTETRNMPGGGWPLSAYLFRKPGKEYHTQRVIIVTKNHRRIVLCEEKDSRTSSLRKIIEEKCGPGVWQEAGASDPSAQA